MNIETKETTGSISNENGYVQTFDDPRRFITSYQIKYDKLFFSKKNYIEILLFIIK